MLDAEFEVNFDFRFWEVRPDWMPFPDWLDDPELRKQIRARSNAMLHKYDIPLPADRGGYRPRTRQMNEAAEYARSLGFLKPYAKALYWAYFIDQRQVGELDVLGQIAEEVGMVRRSLEEAVLNGRFADAVDQHELNACGLGVFGVPTYVINGQTIWGRDMLDVVRDALAAAGVQAR
jgi:predicted DsbA family dithiol-disulfide isomerase